MNFFHKHIKLFYLIPIFLGIVFYLIGYFCQLGFFLVASLIFFLLGIGIFAYDNWKKIFSIYFNFIYVSPKQKYENKLKCLNDETFAEELKLEKGYRRKLYFKSLMNAIFLGSCSLIIFVIIIVALVGLI